MSPPTIHGRFTWHELMTEHPDEAIAFYQKVVGWKVDQWGPNPDYRIWVGSRGPVGGVMAPTAEATAMGAQPTWLSYIGTTDIDATVRDAARLGGRVMKGATEVPSVGRFAVLADPQGAIFAVLQQHTPMTPPAGTKPGEFVWHELVTTDPDGAFNFYHALFGWEKTRAHDMGPLGIYQLFGWPGVDLGGIYRKPPDMPAPPNWLPYIDVANCKAATETLVKQGGKVLNGPMQVPGGGWITMALDPHGIALAIHQQPASMAAKPAAKAKKKAARKPAAKKATKKKPAVKKTARKKAAGRKPAGKKTAKRAKKGR